MKEEKIYCKHEYIDLFDYDGKLCIPTTFTKEQEGCIILVQKEYLLIFREVEDVNDYLKDLIVPTYLCGIVQDGRCDNIINVYNFNFKHKMTDYHAKKYIKSWCDYIKKHGSILCVKESSK